MGLMLLGGYNHGLARSSRQSPQRESIKVVSVLGPVQLRLPGASTWGPVQSAMSIPYTSMLQVEAGGQIVLEGTSHIRSTPDAGTTQLKLQEPSIVRLDPELFAVPDKGAKLFISKNPDNQTAGENDELAPDGFWDDLKERFSIMAFIGDMGDKQPRQVESQGIVVGKKHKKIVILTPEHKELIAASQYPHTMRVIWQDVPRAQNRYSVYLWRMEWPQSRPYAYTNASQMEVAIAEPGDYYLQVTTDDQAYVSRPILLHVGTSAKKVPTPSADKNPIADQTAPTTVDLELPLDQSVILTKAAKIPVEFRWDGGELLSQQGLYRWYLFDEHGKIFDMKETQLPWVSQNLGVGQYTWSIERKWISSDGKIRHFPSERRQLVIEKRMEHFDGFVERLLESPTSLTVVVDP